MNSPGLCCLILIITMILTNCKDSVQVLKKPDNENNWELCPACNGSGVVYTIKSGKSSDDVTNNPGNEYAFCLIPLSLFGALTDDEYLKNRHTENEFDPEYDVIDTEKNYTIMKNNVPERSSVKKKTKCPRCDGKGWIINNNKSSVILKDNVEIIENNGKIEYREK